MKSGGKASETLHVANFAAVKVLVFQNTIYLYVQAVSCINPTERKSIYTGSIYEDAEILQLHVNTVLFRAVFF